MYQKDRRRGGVGGDETSEKKRTRRILCVSFCECSVFSAGYTQAEREREEKCPQLSDWPWARQRALLFGFGVIRVDLTGHQSFGRASERTIGLAMNFFFSCGCVETKGGCGDPLPRSRTGPSVLFRFVSFLCRWNCRRLTGLSFVRKIQRWMGRCVACSKRLQSYALRFHGT